MKPVELDAWPTLPFDAHFRRPIAELAFPIGLPSCSLYARARHGLWHGLRSLGLGEGDELLVPAYHHGSEVEAIVRSGLICAFYEATDDLQPDETELDRLLNPRVRGLYLIHYLGFPQDGRRWREWCDARGLFLIEDAAQAWLASDEGQPIGSFGDISFFSLYKTIGVPDGAALVSAGPAPEGRHSALGLSGVAHRHVAWLASRSPLGARIVSAFKAPERYDPQRDFALGDPWSAPSRTTLFLLQRLADPAVATVRRQNYAALLEQLRDLVVHPFDVLPEGGCPFIFPVETADKKGLLRRLRARGIGAMDLWGVAHPALDLERFPGAASRKSSTVGLPIHQELRRADIARLADAVRISASNPPARLRVETVDTLDAFKEEWQVLAESSRNVFLTWEWISTWWRYFGNGRPLRVSLCSGADDTAVGIVPLYEATRIPVKLLRFLGHGASDELGPVCPTDDPSLAARVLSMTLARLDEPWDLFLGERLRAEGSWESIPGASVVRRDSSPRLRFGGQDWETFLSSLSSNLRAQIRRRERRLASSYRVHYRLATDENRLDDDLDSLFRLHRARWAEVETSFSAIEAFHRETAAIALERRWLRLWFLELDGNPVAAWYGFRFGGVEAYYQAGRDPRYSDLSVGFVLLVHTIRAAIEDGVREYRFLRGGEAYKHRFTSDDPGLLTFGLPRTPAGAAVVLLTAALGEHHPVMRLARRQLDRGSGCSVRRTVP